MKAREVRFLQEGVGGGHWQDRVTEADKLPEGGQKAPADTPVHDWRPVTTEQEVK